VAALPAWLIPLPDAETMRAIDRWAIDEQGVPGLDLMERAGTGVARAVERLAPDGPVAVVCGKGNNGGDGLVVARLLREAGRQVRVACVAPPQDFGGDALVNLTRLPGEQPARCRRPCVRGQLHRLLARQRAGGRPPSTAPRLSSMRCWGPASRVPREVP